MITRKDGHTTQLYQSTWWYARLLYHVSRLHSFIALQSLRPFLTSGDVVQDSTRTAQYVAALRLSDALTTLAVSRMAVSM